MTLLCLILLASTARADLAARVQRLTAPYGNKVGFTFLDLKSGRQLSVNGSREYPAASVAKVPVMACALHLSDLGQLNLKKKVLFRESDKLEGAGVLRWIPAGQEYTLWNLLRLMITLSDNTATRLAVLSVGTTEINSYVKELGLRQTRVIDPTMLVEPPATNNNLTTPDEMAKVVAAIYCRRGFTKGAAKQMITWMNYQRYRWGIWRGVPPGTYVANKTGQLEGILNDVGIVYTKKGDYILSIFTWGFPKVREARILINELSRAAYEEYTGEKVLDPRPAKRAAIVRRNGRPVKKTALKRRAFKKRTIKRPSVRRTAAKPRARRHHPARKQIG
ncbi:MAG: serine hydrolase [Candidatus Margulisiibacteriota bacterium]